jgi:hypothetical protein
MMDFKFGSFETEGAGDVRYVSLPSKEPGVGMVTNIRFRLPQSVHRGCGVHCVHEHIR